jgi:AcrR family transcriptional regulator
MAGALSVDDDRTPLPSAPGRPRDASQTKQQLLLAARRRFAFDGYDATTVRDIATDAGVNVALINRYFDSKEGLFEACITSVGEQLVRSEDAASSIDELARAIVEQIAPGRADSDGARLQIMLLLRSSGDPRAEGIRRGILRRYAEGMATVAGWEPDQPGGDRLILRAQIALATALGIALLLSSSELEPLASAPESQLLEPIRQILATLLSPNA